MARVIPSQILGLHITISGKFNPMTKIMWHHHDGSIEAMGICQPLTPEGNMDVGQNGRPRGPQMLV